VQGGEPVWSPSGELLAYFGGYDVYVVNPNGGAPTQLTDDRAEGISPPLTWSPDGRKIAYVNGQIEPGCDPRGGCVPINSLSIVDVDGSNHRIVEENAYSPIWSPDSHHLLFLEDIGTVTLVDAEGNNRLELAARPDGYFDIASPWSPDGKRILLGIDGDIYIFHLPSLS
jgi:tricorn protease-like protein